MKQHKIKNKKDKKKRPKKTQKFAIFLDHFKNVSDSSVHDLSSIHGEVEIQATFLLQPKTDLSDHQSPSAPSFAGGRGSSGSTNSRPKSQMSILLEDDSLLQLLRSKKFRELAPRIDTLEAVTEIMRTAGLVSANLIFGG